MNCECGGLLLVTAVEEQPEHLTKREGLVYNRVCDVECQKCGRVYYSQPYDSGDMINEVKKTKSI